MPGSSSVNLEKAYEELEREIMEIKQKLQNSISQNESSHDQSASRSAKRGVAYQDGYNNRQGQAALRGSGNGSIDRRSGQYKSLRNTRTSAKSAGKRSGADSRSPGGNGTYGRGEGNLDDPDYSLSVSELNSNLGNSLLKSAARGMGGVHPGGMMEGMSPDSSLAPRFPGEGDTDPRYYNY